MSNPWEVVRVTANMWNVYCGEDCVGYVAGTKDGWRTEDQRSRRGSAYQSAYDQWGPEAAKAVLT